MVNPELWKVRAVPEEVLADLPRRRLAVDESRIRSAEFAVLPHDLAIQRIQTDRARLALPVSRSAMLAETVSAVADRPVSSLGRMRVRRSGPATLFAREDIQIQPMAALGERVAAHTVRETLVRDSAIVDLRDLVAHPALTTVTTSSSSLHVHFEYVLLTITRRIAGTRWWHPELIEGPSWFVPGMKRGAFVAQSEDPAYAYCLPQSLLLVRNVRLTGVWSAEARATMSGAVHYFGPFLMEQPAQTQEAAAGTETTILGLGVQVIAEMCGPLPALPPMDDPGCATVLPAVSRSRTVRRNSGG